MDQYNYDIHNQDNPLNQEPSNKPPQKRDRFGLYSIILGIISIITSVVFYISLIFSVSSIVLSILSRTRIGRFEGKAVVGLCLGIAGIVICLFFFYLMISMVQNPDLVNYLQNIYSVEGAF